MATNLLDLVKGYLTPDIVDKAASYVGESGPATQKAHAGILPTILAALMNQGSTATAVRGILVTGGIADSRIKTAGVGPDKPIASNDTEDGRAKNRRIELVVEKR